MIHAIDIGGAEMNVTCNNTLLVTDQTLDFGSIGYGESNTMSCSIGNYGDEILTLQEPMFTGNHFSLSNFPSAVNPGEVLVFDINFTNIEVYDFGNIREDMFFETNSLNPDEQFFTIFLQGNVLGEELFLTAAIDNISKGDVSPSVSEGSYFATILPNTVETHTFTIKNNGSTDLIFTGTDNVTLSGSTDFNITVPLVSTTLSPDENTSFQITYIHTVEGGASGVVNFMFNDGYKDVTFTFSIAGDARNQPQITNLDSTKNLENLSVPTTIDNNVELFIEHMSTASSEVQDGIDNNGDGQTDEGVDTNGNYAYAILKVERAKGNSSNDIFDFNTTGTNFIVSGNELKTTYDPYDRSFARFTNINGILTIKFISELSPTQALVNKVAQRITYSNNTTALNTITNIQYSLADEKGFTKSEIISLIYGIDPQDVPQIIDLDSSTLRPYDEGTAIMDDDISLYIESLATLSAEIPDNGIDDDGDGQTDEGVDTAGNYAGTILRIQRALDSSVNDMFDFNTTGRVFGALGTSAGTLNMNSRAFASFSNTNGVLEIVFDGLDITPTQYLLNEVAQSITYGNEDIVVNTSHILTWTLENPMNDSTDVNTTLMFVVWDTDSDGLPDHYEVANGLDENDPSDAALDGDSDGLTNLEEYQAGTNPTLSDSDSDGIPDRYEVDNGLNPLDVNDANADADNDGDTNLDEYNAGTDPQDSGSNAFSLLIVGTTQYSLDSEGNIDTLNFENDYTLNGSHTGDSFYNIVRNELQILIDTFPPLEIVHTYTGSNAGIMRFETSVDGGTSFETYFYSTEAERDAALAETDTKLNPALIIYLLN